ncbi:MAG: hypothetical protein V4721_06745 [Bacteroidota bacterium]
MLTPNDQKSDGSFVKYLLQTDEWRSFDPEIYRILQEAIVRKKERDLKIIEKSNIIPNTVFFSETLTDSKHERIDYFNKIKSSSFNCDIIFLDPDNGIEVPSIPYGKRNSSKYIYLHEIVESYKIGRSLLVYQHFTRSNRIQFMSDIAKKVKERLNVEKIYILKMKNAFLILIPQKPHLFSIETSIQEICITWIPHITPFLHDDSGFRDISQNYKPNLFTNS